MYLVAKKSVSLVVAGTLLSLMVTLNATNSVAGATVKNSTHQLTFLTLAQGNALGISPGMPGPNGEVPTFKAVKILPADASGCNQAVCIKIGRVHV